MKERFQIIDSGWDKVIRDAVAADRTKLRVVCPFIKLRAAECLLTGKRPDLIQIITRFHKGEMCDGVNDTKALRLLLENGAKIRGIKHLHAKLYLFGDDRAIVTSANLTEAALLRNHEFGFVTSDDGIVQRCREYFDALWKRAGADLDSARLERWEKEIALVNIAGSRPTSIRGLSDEGAAGGLTETEVTIAPRNEGVTQSFVKFFGEADGRGELTAKVLDEVEWTGCHWACTYPKGKRPRQVQNGAVMFMGRLSKPNDIRIFGRAIAINHVPGRDDATAAEMELIPFKSKWPHYVRVHHAEFVAGTLENGVSLNELKRELKSDAFASTQDNARAGVGNIDPQSAYKQQPSVRLSNEGFRWMQDRLEESFTTHGQITPAELEQLYWPKVRYSG